jgi:hypothetical protein
MDSRNSLMKWLGILSGAVLLLVAVWLLTGPHGSRSGSELAAVVLSFPAPSATPSDLVRAAEQFRDYNPTPANVQEGVRLLGILSDRLTDEEWPKAVRDVYLGWETIRHTPGSHEKLVPVSGRLIEVFATHGDLGITVALIRASNAQDYYAPVINKSFSALAARPVKEYPGSALERLVTSALKAPDYPRAGSYLRAGQIEGNSTRAIRLAKIIGFAVETQAGRAHVTEAIEEWGTFGKDALIGPILLASGISTAKAGKASGDFTPLGNAMTASRGIPDAANYWGEVLQAFLDALPKVGRYQEVDVLESFVHQYASVYPNVDFASAFWEKLAQSTTEKTIAEVMWRIECLKRAAKTGGEEKRRLALARQATTELEAVHAPGQAKALVQEIAVDSPEGKAQIALLLAEIARKEEEEKAALVKRQADQERSRIQGQVDSLKFQLSHSKERQMPPDLVRGLEKTLKDLEKKLPE